VPQEPQRTAINVANQITGLRSSLRAHHFSLSLSILPVATFTRCNREQAGQITGS
jgi:hypothetical protein